MLGRAYRPGRDGVAVPPALGARIAQSVAALAPVEVFPSAAAELTPPATNTLAAPAGAAAPPAPSAAPAEPPSTNGLAPCPLGLAVPTQQAGLANLVALVPFFGPFSPEAFAMVPAFEPGFPLFGPLIVAGGQQLDANADAINAVVGVVRPLEQAGFDALNPLYAPYRQQVLDGEAALANALRPGVAAFAAMPGASCVPALLALGAS